MSMGATPVFAEPSLRFVPGGDAAQQRNWSNSVRVAVERLALPRPQALTVEQSDVSTADGVTVERLAFSGGVRGVLTRPQDPQSAVLLTSAGTGADDALATRLAQRGIAALTVTADYAPAHQYLLSGRSLLAARIETALSAFAWLEARFPTKIGIHGDQVALHTALLSKSDGPVSLTQKIAPYAELGEVEALPGILRYADLPDLAAALAPRPLRNTGQDAVDFFAEELGQARAKPGIPPLRVIFGLDARQQVADRIDQVLASGMLTQGKLVDEFEKVAAEWTGLETVAVSTGTAALDIAYTILNVTGRTVLAPVNTFFATAASIDRLGGKVEFVDAELDGFGMDPKALRAALDRHDDVAAVVVVHIGGVIAPSFMDVLAECRSRGIPVVEDSAHALGARYEGRLAGTFGDMATYSLHPAKVATSGEGGFFGAKDPAHLEAARRLRDHGKISIDKNIHDRLGNNWRLSEVHAAVGLAHFSQLQTMLEQRKELAAWYDEHLHEVPHVKKYGPPTGVDSNYYKYIAFLDPAIDRADLKARLRANHGVSLAGEVYDVLLSEQPYYAERFAGRDFEQAKWFASHHICLPVFPSMTTAEQRQVLEALKSELA